MVKLAMSVVLIGDDYLGLGKLGYWRDTHLRVQGDSIDALQLRFILD